MATHRRKSNNLELLFGRNLRARREALGYTREELAERCHLSPQNIAKIENGDRFVTADSLANIAYSVECQPFELFLPTRGVNEMSNLDKVTALLKNKTDKEVDFAHHVLSIVFKGPSA